MLAEIATWDLLNTKQVCYVLDRELRYLGPQNEFQRHLVICVFLAFQYPSQRQRHWTQTLVDLLYVFQSA